MDGRRVRDAEAFDTARIARLPEAARRLESFPRFLIASASAGILAVRGNRNREIANLGQILLLELAWYDVTRGQRAATVNRRVGLLVRVQPEEPHPNFLVCNGLQEQPFCTI